MMKYLDKMIVQCTLILCSMIFHVIIFGICVFKWESVADYVITHYGVGGPDNYEKKGISSVFYFTFVSIGIESLFVLSWGFFSTEFAIHNFRITTLAKRAIPVCTLLVSFFFSLVNLESVFYTSQWKSTAAVGFLVVGCLLIPPVVLTISSYSETN